MFKNLKIQMRRARFGFIIPVLLFFVLASVTVARGADKPHSWSATLYGGGIFGQNGDTGRFIREYDRYYRHLAQSYGTSISGSLAWPDAGLNLGGEIGYSFSSRFHAGLAFERLSKKSEGSFVDHLGIRHFMDTTISALSISALGRYTMPLTNALSIVYRAGFGVLLGSMDRILTRRFPDVDVDWLLTGDYSASGLTAQAGLGLMWDLNPQFALLLEGEYRLASMSNWSGTNTYTMGSETNRLSGDLYYSYLANETNPGVYHPSLYVGDPNQDPSTVSYRACQAGFSGFGFKAGFIFRFGR